MFHDKALKIIDGLFLTVGYVGVLMLLHAMMMSFKSSDIIYIGLLFSTLGQQIAQFNIFLLLGVVCLYIVYQYVHLEIKTSKKAVFLKKVSIAVNWTPMISIYSLLLMFIPMMEHHLTRQDLLVSDHLVPILGLVCGLYSFLGSILYVVLVYVTYKNATTMKKSTQFVPITASIFAITPYVHFFAVPLIIRELMFQVKHQASTSYHLMAFFIFNGLTFLLECCMLFATNDLFQQWLPWCWIISNFILFQWVVILMKEIVFKQSDTYPVRKKSV